MSVSVSVFQRVGNRSDVGWLTGSRDSRLEVRTGRVEPSDFQRELQHHYTNSFIFFCVTTNRISKIDLLKNTFTKNRCTKNRFTKIDVFEQILDEEDTAARERIQMAVC